MNEKITRKYEELVRKVDRGEKINKEIAEIEGENLVLLYDHACSYKVLLENSWVSGSADIFSHIKVRDFLREKLVAVTTSSATRGVYQALRMESQ